MPKVMLDLSEEMNKNVENYQIKHNISTKTEAINIIFKNYFSEVWFRDFVINSLQKEVDTPNQEVKS